MARQLVVVDLETTGLHDAAVPVEVAVVNADTGETLRFVPYVTERQIELAQPEALRINGYHERELWREMLSVEATMAAWANVRGRLQGNVFGGSNPTYDSGLVRRQLVADGVMVGKVWHHRLADLAAYSAGKFDYDPTDLRGLDDVANDLGVAVSGRHTALGDAATTALCFDILRRNSADELSVIRKYSRADLKAATGE